MPDANGAIKGTGWSRKGEDAWTRVFGNAATQQQRREEWLHNNAGTPLPLELRVPTRRAAEVPRPEDEHADREAARQGLNPEW